MRPAKRALAAAEPSEERFSRILSIAAEAIIPVDGTQRIILFNEGAEHISGYRRHEIMGQPLTTLRDRIRERRARVPPWNPRRR